MVIERRSPRELRCYFPWNSHKSSKESAGIQKNNKKKEREIENPEQVVPGDVWENSGMKYFKNLHW